MYAISLLWIWILEPLRAYLQLSTRSEILASQYGFVHLSTALLRSELYYEILNEYAHFFLQLQ